VYFPVSLNRGTVPDTELAMVRTPCCSSASALPAQDAINNPNRPITGSDRLAPRASMPKQAAMSCLGSGKRRKTHRKRQPLPRNSIIKDHALKMPQVSSEIDPPARLPRPLGTGRVWSSISFSSVLSAPRPSPCSPSLLWHSLPPPTSRSRHPASMRGSFHPPTPATKFDQDT
jgi:hypothetical protein